MKKVAILMSTYNGDKYLEEQLHSLENLDSKDLKVDIKIRDDGSSDQTIHILNEYAQMYKNINWYQGENKKSAYSFLELLKNNNGYDYYSFCDQDDVWHKEKVKQAVLKLEQYDDKPAIYFSAVNVVDEDLKFLLKKEFNFKFTFANSFVINPAIGCTIVINNKLKQFIDKLDKKGEIEMHDAWIYRMAQAIDSKVIYDKNSYIDYRQHANNVEGVKDYENIFKKSWYFISGKKRKIAEVSENILKNYKKCLTSEKIDILQQIVNLSKNHSLKNKIKLIKNAKFKTNNLKQDLKFHWDIIFNRI